MGDRLTLISTIKNEEKSIESYLKSILEQSRVPDEIILVDGGSIDRTVDIINEFILKGAPLKLIIDKKANIARGRNIAIANSSSEIILSTDAGCKLDKDWVKNISKPLLEKKADVVAGFYLGAPETFFEKCVSAFTLPKKEQFCVYQPSSSSVAFTKEAWRKAGGYPEWLYTAEDTLFNVKLKEAGCKFVFAEDAIVYWRPRGNFRKLFKQYYLYAVGDSRAKLFASHYREKLLKYIMVIINIIVAVKNLLALVLFAYFLYSYWQPRVNRVYREIKDRRVFVLLPLIITTMDIAKVLGYLFGKFKFTPFKSKQ